MHPDGRPDVVAPELALDDFLGVKASEALMAGSPSPYAKLNAATADKNVRPMGLVVPGKIRLERHSAVEKMTSSNVLGLLPGSDPHLASEVILLTAHLDHDGIVDPVKGDKVMNGAMDNASGLAIMLEAARAFVERGTRPKRSIMFAALTAEEDGLLGAGYLAKYPVFKDKKVVGVVNLDMPILTYDFEDVIAFGAEHSTMRPAVNRALAPSGIKQSPDPMPEEGMYTRSDHYMFVKEGIPSIFLATGWGGPGKVAVQDFLAKHYHQVSDKPALPFNWAATCRFSKSPQLSLTKMGRLASEWPVLSLAEPRNGPMESDERAAVRLAALRIQGHLARIVSNSEGVVRRSSALGIASKTVDPLRRSPLTAGQCQLSTTTLVRLR